MDDSLLFEVEGRSIELRAINRENRTMERLRDELIAFTVQADIDGLTPKRRELGMRAIIDAHYSDEEALLNDVASDTRNQFRLAQRRLE